MTSITRRVRWEAAHFLPFPNVGKCSRVHGHSWSAEVELSGPVKTEGPDAGMIVDMGEVGRYFRDELEDGLDPRLLNDTLPAEYQPPTTENVARYLLDAFVAGGFPVVSVMVRETENQTATVRAA